MRLLKQLRRQTVRDTQVLQAGIGSIAVGAGAIDKIALIKYSQKRTGGFADFGIIARFHPPLAGNVYRKIYIERTGGVRLVCQVVGPYAVGYVNLEIHTEIFVSKRVENAAIVFGSHVNKFS